MFEFSRVARQNRVALIVLAVLAAGACGMGSTSRSSAAVRVDPERARRTLSVLAADSMEGRQAGSTGAARAARFIAAELREHGVDPAYPSSVGRDSGYFQRYPLVRQPQGGLRLLPSWADLDSVPAERRVIDANVVGILPGADPEFRDEVVIVGAHYDHVGIGPAVDGDSVYNGADDDASGVVTVLEVARALAKGPAPRRTVVFLLTSGEEEGLLGTRWYLEHPVRPLQSTVADLQVEMVGRPDTAAGGSGRGWLTGYERSSLGAALAAAGIPIVPDPRPTQQFFLRSDNIAFACQGIPAHTLSSFGLHDDYHQPGDELEAVDFPHLVAVIEAAIRAVHFLADGPRPTWTPTGDPSGNPAICG
jgi:hypothetical protein